jgi:peptidyl-prolyl cis-trans isomerase B (cyclophilin B)
MTTVTLHTNFGDIVIKLAEQTAPLTCANFLQYASEGFFNHTIFHRVIKDFVIQSGGYNNLLIQKPVTHPDIYNEATAAAKNIRGTIAMARDIKPHSANCEFFINIVDNPRLDHKSNNPDEYGYCVFGQIVQGLEVIDKINLCPTKQRYAPANIGQDQSEFANVPIEPVKILNTTIDQTLDCYSCLSQLITSKFNSLQAQTSTAKISPYSSKANKLCPSKIKFEY